MKKLLSIVVVAAALFYGYHTHSTNAVETAVAEKEALLVGTWKFYAEHSDKGSTVTQKSTTVYAADGTESSSSAIHLSSGVESVSGAIKIKSNARWRIEGDSLFETKLSTDFYGYSGAEVAEGFFDAMERDSRERLNVEREIRILKLTDTELVVATDDGEQAYKRK